MSKRFVRTRVRTNRVSIHIDSHGELFLDVIEGNTPEERTWALEELRRSLKVVNEFLDDHIVVEQEESS